MSIISLFLGGGSGFPSGGTPVTQVVKRQTDGTLAWETDLTSDPGAVTWAGISGTAAQQRTATSESIHKSVDGEIHAVTSKTTPVANDEILLEDSAASYAKKRATLTSLPISSATSTALGTKADATALAGYVPTTTQIVTATGSGLSGGDALDSDVTLILYIPDITTGSTVDPAADYLVMYDNSEGGNRKVLVEDFPFDSTDTTAIHTDVSGEIAGLSAKATPVGADLLVIEDSADTNAKKKITISTLPAAGSDSDAIHVNVDSEIYGLTSKALPTSSDLLVIEDAADSYNKKKVAFPTGTGLFDAGVLNVKTTGAVGDGATDDYDAFCDARDDVSTLPRYVPAGTYKLGTAFDFSVADQIWIFEAGSVLKLASDIDNYTVRITADRVKFRGILSVDGNRAGNETYSAGTLIYDTGADDCEFEDIRIISSPASGIFVRAANRLRGGSVYSKNTVGPGYQSFFSDTSSAVGIRIGSIYVDKTDEIDADTNGRGVELVGNVNGYYAYGCNYGDITIISNPDWQGINIEVNSHSGCSIGSITSYGCISIAVSLSGARDLSIGSIAITCGGSSGANGEALEVGQCNNVSIGSVSISPTDTAAYSFYWGAMAIDTNHLSIGSLEVTGFRGNALTFGNGNYCSIGSAVFNTDADGTYGISIDNSHDINISNVVCRKTSENKGGSFLHLTAASDNYCYNITISNFTCSNIFTFIAAGYMDKVHDFHLSHGVVDSYNVNQQLDIGSNVPGANITITDVVPITRSGTQADVLDLAGNVIRARGTGSPESAIAAGVGSHYWRTDGGVGTTLYVKTSGTSNTGWSAVNNSDISLDDTDFTGVTTFDSTQINTEELTYGATYTFDVQTHTDFCFMECTGNVAFTLSNLPADETASKQISLYSSDASTHTCTFTNGTISPASDTFTIPAAGSSIVIYIDWDGTTAFVSAHTDPGMSRIPSASAGDIIVVASNKSLESSGVTYGTGADNLLQLDSSGNLPAVDGSALIGLLSTQISDVQRSVTDTDDTEDADLGKTIVLNKGTDFTLTIHSTAAAGFYCNWVNIGAGQVTFAAGGTGAMLKTATKTSMRYGFGGIYVVSNAGTAPQVVLGGDITS